VELEDELPPGLLLDGVEETTEPGEKGESLEGMKTGAGCDHLVPSSLNRCPMVCKQAWKDT
jgi:hypothetical protein